MSSRKSLHNLVDKYLNLLILANTYIDKHGFKMLIRKTTGLIKAKFKANNIMPKLVTKQQSEEKSHLLQWSQIDMDARLDLNAIGLYKTNIGESYTTVVTDSVGSNSFEYRLRFADSLKIVTCGKLIKFAQVSVIQVVGHRGCDSVCYLKRRVCHTDLLEVLLWVDPLQVPIVHTCAWVCQQPSQLPL